MKTQEAIDGFLTRCEVRGLGSETIRKYKGFLRRFAEVHPELPTDQPVIEAYLKKQKETPAHRGTHFKALQALYSDLELQHICDSPVPPRGKIGRPSMTRTSPITEPAQEKLAGPGDEEEPVPSEKGTGEELRIRTAEAVDSFIKSMTVQGVTKRTLQERGYQFKPFIGRFPMLPLTVEPLEEFLGSLQVGAETRWTYRKTIMALYHFLEQRKRIPKNLVTVPQIRVPKKVRRVLSEDDLRALFPGCKNFMEKAMLTVLIDAKLRASELCNLEREKVFPDHLVVTGKNGERSVPISPTTYDMLIQLATSGFVFRCEGRQLRREFLRVTMRRLMHDSGLTGAKLGPHILRHSTSVQHMVHGGDLLSLKEELGHQSTKMTEHYARLAFPQVKQKHAQVNVLGNITNSGVLERATCYACGQEIVLELEKKRETECPKCHQIGSWYTPDERAGGPE